MAINKLTRKRPNKLLTARMNYFADAGPILIPPANGLTNNTTPITALGFTNPLIISTSSGGGLGAMSGLLGAAGSMVGQLGGSAIADGYSSGAGKVMSGLSGLASNIPGIGGAVISAGLGLLGGAADRLLGSKWNDANVAAVKQDTAQLNNVKADVGTFDELEQLMANTSMGASGLGVDDLVQTGIWAGSGDTDKAERMLKKRNEAQSFAERSFANNAYNINMDTLAANELNFAAQGGKIHIKPSKRGTFTAAASKHNMGVQEFASKVLANKDNYSPAMVKKANFARNASKWHAFGGDLLTHGANFDTGLTMIGNGGTHELNPYEGVPMGVDPEGVPNVVEEGEVIFNDYVFSKRLKVPKAIRSKYKLKDNTSFADAAMKLGKESEERPNDPISQNGLFALLGDLAGSLEEIRAKKMAKQLVNYAAEGGKINKFDGMAPSQTIKHDKSINAAPMYAQGADYRTKRDYIYDNWDSDYVKNWVANTYIPYINDYNKGRENYTPYTVDTVSRDLFDRLSLDSKVGGFHRGIDKFEMPIRPDLDRVTVSPPTLKPDAVGISALSLDRSNLSPGELAVNGAIETARRRAAAAREANQLGFPDYDDPLRYAPIAGSTLGLFTSLMDTSDGGASRIQDITNRTSTYDPVKFKPIHNYLTYKPFDIEFAANQANAESAAARRTLMNTSGGNRAAAMSGILAADYNALGKLGELRRGAMEDNWRRRKEVEEFNRGTNQYNSEGIFKASAANQSAAQTAYDRMFRGSLAAEQAREQARLAREQSIAANLSNLTTSLGNIGEENLNRKERRLAMKNGLIMPYRIKEAKLGGKLNRVKKRGLTY